MSETTTTALDTIVAQARVLSESRARLAEVVGALNRGIEDLKADRMPAVRMAIDEAAAAWSELESLIRSHPELFVKPRQVSAHGIKFGFEKGKGSIEISDEKRTVDLIRKHFPDQADVLIDTKYTPAKGAIAQLTANDLKRIGAEMSGTKDRVVIRASDTETDKLVKALLTSAVDGDEG